jgi:signal transduction histidine kinase/CheY-like chemotaxis protein
MAVQILFVDDSPDPEALPAVRRAGYSVSRARSVEGALEMLRWIDYRLIVLVLDGAVGAAPPRSWPTRSLPPIVTLGGALERRERWAAVARRQVLGADQLVSALREVASPGALLLPSSGTSCSADLCPPRPVRAILEAAVDGCVLIGPGRRVAYLTDAARALLEPWGPLEPGAPWPAALEVETRRVVETAGRRFIEITEGPGLECPCRALWIRDVTARERSGELEQRLLHSDRLAAMGQLAAGVAHEVNNPAAFVTANLCMMSEYVQQIASTFADLEKRAEKDETLAGHLGAVSEVHNLADVLVDCRDIIRENLEGMGRISTILRDLRSFSRIEEHQIELVHANEIVNAACSLAHNQIRHRARLIKTLGAVEPVAADRNKLVQVLMNLLMNAAQATPDDASEAHFIEVSTEMRDGRVCISVTDNGIGMTREVRERVFEPFFTTKSRDKGTGLGLALCADIVRQHGGDIDLRSVPGEGSRFVVRLPIESTLAPDPERAPKKSAPLPRPPSPPPGRRGAVLLVDDEVMLLKAFRRALSKHHDVHTVTSGDDALELFRAGREYDVVVCDLMMPGTDGIRLYEQLDTVAPHLKSRFIFCSGGAFTPRAKAFCRSLTVPVLEKPMANEVLLDAIHTAMAGRREDPRATTDLGRLPSGPQRPMPR